MSGSLKGGVLRWLALMVAALVLSGCGGATSPGQSRGQSGPVVVWIGAGADSELTKQYLAAAGERLGLEITVEALPSQQLNKQLPLALRTGQGPDVFSPNNLGALANAGYLHELDDLVPESVKAELGAVIGTPSNFRREGKLVAVPTNAVQMKLIYNKDLFRAAGLDPDKPPTTMSEVVDYSKQIKQRAGAAGFGLPLKANSLINWAIDPMIINANPALTRQGLYNSDTRRYEMERYTPAIEMGRTMIADGTVLAGYASLDLEALRVAFAQGKVAMYIDQTSAAPELDGVLKTTQDWSAAATPVPDGMQLQQEIVHIGGSFSINNKTKNLEAAAKVLNELISVDLATKKAEGGFDLPVNPTIDLSTLTLSGSERLKLFAYDPKTQRPSGVSPSDELDIQGDTWRTGVTKLFTSTGDAEASLRELSAKYNAELEKSVSSNKLNLDNFGNPL